MELEYMGSLIKCRDRNRVEERLLTEEIHRIDDHIAQLKLQHKTELSKEKKESVRLSKEAARARRRDQLRRREELADRWTSMHPTEPTHKRTDRLDLRTPQTRFSVTPELPESQHTPLAGHEQQPTQGRDCLKRHLSPAARRQSLAVEQRENIDGSVYRNTANFALFFNIHKVTALKKAGLSDKKKKANAKSNPIAALGPSRPPPRSSGKSAIRRLIIKQAKKQDQKAQESQPWVGEPRAIQSIRRDRKTAKDLIEAEALREPIRKLTREMSLISSCTKGCSKKSDVGPVKPVHNYAEVEIINSQIHCPQSILDDLEPLASRSNVNNQALVGYLHRTWERTLSSIDLHAQAKEGPFRQIAKKPKHQTSLPAVLGAKLEVAPARQGSIASLDQSMPKLV